MHLLDFMKNDTSNKYKINYILLLLLITAVSEYPLLEKNIQAGSKLHISCTLRLEVCVRIMKDRALFYRLRIM